MKTKQVNREITIDKSRRFRDIYIKAVGELGFFLAFFFNFCVCAFTYWIVNIEVIEWLQIQNVKITWVTKADGVKINKWETLPLQIEKTPT